MLLTVRSPPVFVAAAFQAGVFLRSYPSCFRRSRSFASSSWRPASVAFKSSTIFAGALVKERFVAKTRLLRGNVFRQTVNFFFAGAHQRLVRCVAVNPVKSNNAVERIAKACSVKMPRRNLQAR